MKNEKFCTLKKDVQEIIDLMKIKDYENANKLLVNANAELDEMLDFVEEDIYLIEISKYQVLLNHLQIKINTASKN